MAQMGVQQFGARLLRPPPSFIQPAARPMNDEAKVGIEAEVFFVLYVFACLDFFVLSVNKTPIKLILIGERSCHNFQSFEKIGDMYQYTEAFSHYYSRNSSEAKKSSSLNFTYLNLGKIQKEIYARLKNRAKNMAKL